MQQMDTVVTSSTLTDGRKYSLCYNANEMDRYP